MSTIIEDELQYMVREDANWIIPERLAGMGKIATRAVVRIDSYFDTEHQDLNKLGMSLRIRQDEKGRVGEWQFKMKTKADEPTKRSRVEIADGMIIAVHDSYPTDKLPRTIQEYLPEGTLKLIGVVVTESIDVDYKTAGDFIALSLETVTYDDGHMEKRIEAEGTSELLDQTHTEISKLYNGMLSVPTGSKYQQCLDHRKRA